LIVNGHTYGNALVGSQQFPWLSTCVTHMLAQGIKITVTGDTNLITGCHKNT